MGAAADEWDAIQADPEFRAQPMPEQNRVALSFFNKRIAPQVPAEQQDAVRHDFFGEAFKPPEPVAPQSKWSMTKEVAGSPVPVLGEIADDLRTKTPQLLANAGENLGFPKTGAALGTAVGTVGELVPKSMGEATAAVVGGPLLEGAGYLGAKAAPTVVSKLAGWSVPEAERAISRATELMNPTLVKPETIDAATKTLGESLKSVRSAVGRRLGVAEDAAAAKLPGRVVSAAPIADELAGNLRKVGYAVDGGARGDVPNQLPPKIQEIVDKLRNVGPGLPSPDGISPPPVVPRPLSLPDALQVKRDIYELVSYDKSHPMAVGDKESAFLKDAADNLNQHIRAIGGDELNAATDKFSRMADAYDKLHKDVMSGKTDTIQKRLGRLFNSGDIERKVGAPIDVVGAGRRALDTILDAKTAQAAAPYIRPGIERAATTTGGGILGASGTLAAKAYVGGPAALAAGAGVLAATSPALNNALIRATMVPIGRSAAVDALASPTARALTGTTVLRKLLTRGK